MIYTTNKKRWYISLGEILTAGVMEENEQIESYNEFKFFDNEKAWKYEILELNILPENILIKTLKEPEKIEKPIFGRDFEAERVERLKKGSRKY